MSNKKWARDTLADPKTLDEILDSYAKYQYQLHVDNDGSHQLNKLEATQSLKQLFLDMVGPDEVMLDWEDPAYDLEEAEDKETRNELRAELRERIKKL